VFADSGKSEAPLDKSQEGRGRCSVVTGQQNSCGGAISFSDDPEGFAANGAVDREQSQTYQEGFVVGLAVVFINLAPVADDVAVEGRLHLGWSDDIEGGRCRDQSADWKEWMGQ